MLPALDEEVIRHRIAKRIALDFEDGAVVNLGIGIPTLVSDYLPEDVHVLLQTENGVVGAGPKPEKEDLRFIGAGGRCVSLLPGSSLVASDASFGLIRGGHLDATVLGALEVDSSGNLANWMIPGKMVPGMGGAMDLVTGAGPSTWPPPTATRRGDQAGEGVHLPLTGEKVVSVVVTEFCVIRKVNGKMVLCEIAPEVTEEELRTNTTMEYDVSPDLCPMRGIE